MHPYILYMHVYVNACIHEYIQTHNFLYRISDYVHTCTLTFTHLNIHTHIHTRIHTCEYNTGKIPTLLCFWGCPLALGRKMAREHCINQSESCFCMCVCVYICVCMYVCMYVCMEMPSRIRQEDGSRALYQSK